MNLIGDLSRVIEGLKTIKNELSDQRKTLNELMENKETLQKGSKLQRFLMIHEVAEILGVHQNSVKNYMKQCNLVYTNIGPLKLIDEDDLVAYLEKNKRSYSKK